MDPLLQEFKKGVRSGGPLHRSTSAYTRTTTSTSLHTQLPHISPTSVHAYSDLTMVLSSPDTLASLDPSVARHKCLYCGKNLGSPKDLRRHVLTHTGEKPHACPFCPYRAALKGNLKVHIIGVHRQIVATSDSGGGQ